MNQCSTTSGHALCPYYTQCSIQCVSMYRKLKDPKIERLAWEYICVAISTHAYVWDISLNHQCLYSESKRP